MKNFKSKMMRFFSTRNSGNKVKRIVTFLLATVLVISVLPIGGIGVKGAGETVTNFPLLNEFVSKKGLTGANWNLGFKDYSEKPAFVVSDTNFTGSTATWDADNSIANVSWSSVSGAEKYNVKVFKGTTLSVSATVTAAEWTSAYNELTGGEEYQIQVIAFDSADNRLAASGICIFETDASVTSSSYNYTGDAPVYMADTINKSKNYWYNKDLYTSLSKKLLYTFTTTATKGRNVKITAETSSQGKYGAYLAFTAANSGTYEFSSGLTVNSLSSASGRINSRIIKIDLNGNETTVWPYNSSADWDITEITSSSAIPQTNAGAPQVKLNAGEQMVLQVYLAETGTSTSATADISFANPTVTKLSDTASYKSGIRSYNFGAYAPQYIFGTDSINSGWVQYNARWSSEVIKVTSNTVSKTYDYTKWDASKNNEALTASVKNNKNKAYDIGYAYYTRVAPAVGVEGALMLGADSHGVAFNFESPASGTALISATVTGSTEQTLKYRLVKNGVQVYPAGVGGTAAWKNITEAGETAISVSCDANLGDVLSLQFYCEADSDVKFNINTMPSVTLYESDVANKPIDSVFSPLWERPFEGQTDGQYNFVPISGNAWQFGIICNPNASGQYVTDANTYTTADKYLFSKGDASKLSGYIFDDSELKFKIGDSKYGMSLTFMAPVSAYYDFSTALNQVGKAEGVYFRFLKNDNKLWPKDGEWASFSSLKGDLPAQETLLAAGETVTLQIYANLGKAEEGVDNSVTVGLGTVAVQKLDHKSQTGTKTILSYEPVNYKVFEESYASEYVNLQGRFNYSMVVGENIDYPKTSNSANQSLTFSDNASFITLSDKPLQFVSAGGTETVIEYVANTSSSAEINLKAASITAGTLLQIANGENVILDWTDNIPQTTEIQLAKGDKLTFKFKNSVNYDVNFDAFVIMVEAESASDDITENTTYYAIKSNISTESLYTGKYRQPESSYWYFDLYKTAEDEIVGANYYVGDTIPRVYNTDLNQIGYYFEGTNLSAEIEKSASAQNGLALGFKAPKDNTYNFKTGMVLTTDGAQATVKARLIVFKAGESTAEKVWPKDSEWFEKDIAQGESLDVPFLSVDLAEGDTAYFVAYASESNTAKLKFNMASPAFAVATVSSVIEDARQTLNYYDATDSIPYSAVSGYSGTYIPMTDRWNFYFTQNGNVYNSTNYDKTSSNATLSNKTLIGGSAYKFTLNNKSLESFSYILARDSASDVGSMITFYAPEEGDYMLNAPLWPSTFNKVDGAAIKFRVVKRDSSSGKETVVWPKDGSDWEILDSVSLPSNCRKVRVTANMGDEFIFESMLDISDEDRAAYFSANASKQYVEIKAKTDNSSICAVKYVVDDTVTSYSSSNALTDNTQDSLWTIQYSLYADNPQWRNTYRGSIGNYWTSDGIYDIIGVSIVNGGKMIIQNKNDNFAKANTERVSTCYLFTVPRDGYLRMSSSVKATCSYLTERDGLEGMVRVTKNGEVVWPEDATWQRVNADTPAVFEGLEFECVKGDEIRFEYTTDVYPIVGAAFYMNWIPSFLFTKEANYYNVTDDIYSYLGNDMTAYFQGITSATFADNDAAGKLMSEQVAARKAAAAAAGPYVPPTDDGSSEGGEQQITTTTTTTYTPGDYTEWTEEIYTPGKKTKKTYTKIIGTNWTPIIIAIVSAVVALGGVVTVLLILQKKGTISLFKKTVK